MQILEKFKEAFNLWRDVLLQNVTKKLKFEIKTVLPKSKDYL